MSDVIREFLVSLGFRIDANGMRRFQDAVGGSTSSVSGLGRAAFDASLQVADAIEKMAKQYESLSYASQRTGASTSTLKAAAYAFSQIGSTAEEGAAAIERFADVMMNDPGKKSFVEGWGATAEDTALKLKQFMHNIKKAYPDQKDYFIASRYAELGGVGNDIFKQYFNNSEEFDKYFDSYVKKIKDAKVDPKATADASKELGRSFTELNEDIFILKTQLLQDLIPPLKDSVEWFDKLVQSASHFLAIPAAVHHEGLKEKRDKFRSGAKNWMGEHEWNDRPSWLMPDLAESEKFKPGANSTVPPDGANSIRNSIRVPTSPASRAQYVADFFMKQGWSKAQAWAIAGTLNGETSNFNPNEGGQNGENSYGVGQWHPERRADFKRVFGKEMQGSSLDEQLAFAQWELTQGPYKKAGEHLRRTTTPQEGVGVLVPEYERPANTLGNIRSRGAVAEEWFKADLGRRPSTSGWGARTEPTDEQNQAASFAQNAQPSSPDITQHNNFTVHINGVTEPDKVRDAMRDGARDWSRITADQLAKRQDTMR